LVSSATTKIQKVDSRHTIYLHKALVEDSLFPFRPNEPLIVRVEGQKLIVERAKAK
jgi:hypothetical protein